MNSFITLIFGLLAISTRFTSAIRCEFLDDHSTISVTLKTFPKEDAKFLAYKYSDVTDPNTMIGWSFDKDIPLISCQQTSKDNEDFQFHCSSFDNQRTRELDNSLVNFIALKELNYLFNITERGFYCASVESSVGFNLEFHSSNRSAVSFVVHYGSYPIFLMFIPIIVAIYFKINMDITYITILTMFYSIITTYSLSVSSYFNSVIIEFILIFFQSVVDLGSLSYIFIVLTERAQLNAQGENMIWLFVGMLSRFLTMVLVFGVKLLDPLGCPILGFSTLESFSKAYMIFCTLGFVSAYVAFLYKAIDVHKLIEDQKDIYHTLVLLFGYPLVYTFIWIILHLFIWLKNFQFLNNFVDDWFAMGSSMLDNASYLVFISLLVYIHWDKTGIYPLEDIEFRETLV